MTAQTLLLRLPAPQAPATATHWLTASLSVAGQDMSLCVGVPDTSIRLSDLVAPARQICDWLLQAAVQPRQASGPAVSCQKGCSACCHYLVPLSVPEALLLPAEIAALPPRAARQKQAAFLAAASKILHAPPPRLSEPGAQAPGKSSAGQAGHWYADLQLPCPLLADNLCTLHAQRPLACREHLVCSPPADCAGFLPGRGRILDPGLSLSTALAQLASDLEGRPLEAVLLPLALAWWPDNASRASQTYHAPHAVSRLLRLLEQQLPATGSLAA